MKRFAFTLIELLVVIALISILAGLLLPVIYSARESGRASACLSNEKQIALALIQYTSDYDETFPMNRFADDLHQDTGCTAASGSTLPQDALQGSTVNWKRVLPPYGITAQVLSCPSNVYLWKAGGYNHAPGDESNYLYAAPQRLPNSYAFNGNFFHEAVPACWYGEQSIRPRRLAEISSPSSLIMVIESRANYPDIGNWFIQSRISDQPNLGEFQSHRSGLNWCFADSHVKWLKLPATCTSKMWTDTYRDAAGGCDDLKDLAQEYK